jgi:hypothetical protein
LQLVSQSVSQSVSQVSRSEVQNIIKVKVKVKLSLCLTKHHAMKTYSGSGGIAPRVLDLGTRLR